MSNQEVLFLGSVTSSMSCVAWSMITNVTYSDTRCVLRVSLLWEWSGLIVCNEPIVVVLTHYLYSGTPLI